MGTDSGTQKSGAYSTPVGMGGMLEICRVLFSERKADFSGNRKLLLTRRCWLMPRPCSFGCQLIVGRYGRRSDQYCKLASSAAILNGGKASKGRYPIL